MMQVKLSRHLYPEGICLCYSQGSTYEQDLPVTKHHGGSRRTTVTARLGFNFSSHGTSGAFYFPEVFFNKCDNTNFREAKIQ